MCLLEFGDWYSTSAWGTKCEGGGQSGLKRQSWRQCWGKLLLCPFPRGGGGGGGGWLKECEVWALWMPPWVSSKQVLPKRASFSLRVRGPQKRIWMEIRSWWQMVAASRRGTARILGEPDGKFQWGVLKKATEAAKRVKSPFTYSQAQRTQGQVWQQRSGKNFPPSPGLTWCEAVRSWRRGRPSRQDGGRSPLGMNIDCP